jgi:acetylornithine deacetylase/succinyl-diaminopimelate desuccinylase-like protein
MDHGKVRDTVVSVWADQVLPSLAGLVEIPALSPAFDSDWERTGHLRAAADHVRDWIESRDLPGARSEIVQLEGRSPVLLIDIPATSGATEEGTLLLYGHLDKQPPFGGWSEGLAP